MQFENSVNIQGRSQQSLSGGGTAKLAPGVYDFWAAVDTYIVVNKDQTIAAAASSANGYYLAAGNTVPFQISSDSYVGSSAACKFHQVA